MLAIILSNVVALRLDNLDFPTSKDALCQSNMCKVYSSSTTLITMDSENFRPEKFTLARAEKENTSLFF